VVLQHNNAGFGMMGLQHFVGFDGENTHHENRVRGAFHAISAVLF
jgi:hypothetical protein